MATFRFGKYDNTTGANVMGYFSMAYSLMAGGATASSTLVTNAMSGVALRIVGEDMVFGVAPAVGIIDGTVNGITLKHNGKDILTTSGLSVDGEKFVSTVVAGPMGFVLAFMSGNDLVLGSALGDSLTGGYGNDTIRAGGGNDLVQGFFIYPEEQGRKTIFGEGGNDTIQTAAGDDRLYGGGGNDVLSSQDGRDIMSGGGGNDTLQGLTGSMRGLGGAGNDSLNGGYDSNRLYGGSGNDTLYGQMSRDTLDGGTGSDTIYSQNGDDRLSGGAGGDLVYAGYGDDRVDAGSGNDSVFGDYGNDTLFGGAGNDNLYGGSNVDLFVFNTTLGASNVDYIDDMEVNFDKIVLDRSIFAQMGATGLMSNAKLKIGLNATDANDRIIYNSVTGQLYYDRDGNGAAAKVLFATLDTGLQLDGGDFLIIA